MPKPMLSKSRYLNGLQCPRLLRIATNEPERIPEPDAATQHIFDQGHLVGELAEKLFHGGIDVPTNNSMGNINLTRDYCKSENHYSKTVYCEVVPKIRTGCQGGVLLLK